MTSPSEAERRVDASMSLLTSMLERPLDPGYAAAAERRERAGLTPGTSWRTPLVLALAVSLGLVLGVSGAALQAQENPRVQARARLVAQIETQRALVDKRRATVATLQAEVVALGEAGLGLGDTAGAAQLRLLSQVSGAVPVSGPGLVLTLDDSTAAQQRVATGGSRVADGAKDYVMARDLQIVTNSLWAAGAEAISVNGQRLTSTSAIRFAGEAILVDYRPLARPYVVTAIGDPTRFPGAFAQGPGGAYLASVSTSFGLLVDTVTRSSVTVPASSTLLVRYAAVTRPPRPSASPTPSTSGGTP